MSARPRVLFAALSLEAGNGGVARVARLSARVMAHMANDGRIDVEAVTFMDARPVGDLGLRVRTARGSRLRFVAEVHRRAVTTTHAVYDSLASARAHPRVPMLRRPSLVWIHGVDVWHDPRDPLASIRERTARAATVLISNSSYTRERSGLTRANVCWLATETDARAASVQRLRRPCVLMMSRVDEAYKGHDAMIDCWPEVVATVPDAVLLFAGGGPRLDYLRQRAASSVVARHIEVLGFVPEAEIERVWERATVFALPSRGEGFGLVYIEAMRHGLPVLATIHDAAQEINVDGVTGFNVDLESPGQLAQRLVQLLRDPATAQSMGERGAERWNEHFRFSAFETRFTQRIDAFLALR